MNETSADLARAPAWLTRFLQACLALLLIRQVWWLLFGPFNVDEFENVQIIWLWRHGVWPVRDYLHPHLIVYNLLLAPLFTLFGAQARLLGAVRLFLFPLVLLTVWQAWWIGRRVGGEAAGWLAAILFLAPPLVGYSLSEMRPDALAMPLALGAVMCFLVYADRGAPRRWLLGAGLLLGLNFLFTQKTIYLALVLLWMFERYHFRVQGWPLGRRLRALGSLCLLAFGPVALAFAAYFAAGFLSWEQLLVLSGNALQGIPAALNWSFKFRILGQYALTAGLVLFFGLWGLGRLVVRRDAWRAMRQPGALLVGLFLLVSGAQTLTMSLLFHHLLVLPHLFVSVLAARVLRQRAALLAAAVVLLQIVVPQAIDRALLTPRGEQMAAFRFVQERVPSNAPVLDSYRGYGAFRPIVGRLIYFRPPHVGGELMWEKSKQVVRLVAAERFGAVIKDASFDFYPESLRRLILQHYAPSPRFADVWLPKGKPAGP